MKPKQPVRGSSLRSDRFGRGLARMSLRADVRLLLLLVMYSGLSVLGVLLSYRGSEAVFAAYSVTQKAEAEGYVRGLLELVGSSLAHFTDDYSYWDDMVQFAAHPDSTWAEVNIIAALAMFDVDAVWVYGRDGVTVFAAAADSGLDCLLPAGVAPDELLRDTRLRHYFLKHESSLVEVRAATIHPSEDRERKTLPQGYFFVARIWNDAFVRRLAGLTSCSLAVVPLRPTEPHAGIVAEAAGKGSFGIVLDDWHGRPVGMLSATVSDDWSRPILDARWRTFRHSVGLAALAVVLLALCLWCWVTRPLRLIAGALAQGPSERLLRLGRARNEFGQVARLVAESARQREELSRLNELKNQFLGMAAHDLRNPLGVITAASGFLLEGAGRSVDESKRHTLLQRILASSRFMLALIDELLDVSRIESGRLDLKLREEDLAGIVAENLALNEMLATTKDIVLKANVDPGLPKVRFDRARIEQVINNLISNAIKFSSTGTTVNVRAGRLKGAVVVSVEDEGPGIPSDELGKLFQPFSRTSVRSTAGEKSTGLGLAISLKIVEAHGGRIWAESEVGKGSVFHFSLPVTNE